MAEAKRGAVVTLASVTGLVAWGGCSAYSASKAGVIGLSRFLAIEYAPFGIRVNCVCPGAVRTPMATNRWNSSDNPQQRYANTVAKHPLGRVAEPEEVAQVIEFALSERSGFMTGSTLMVDGGLVSI
jgi:NAD(P)-dependent dehydrogenase (short-subunit alcohol dehydrogenase family)